MRRWPLQGWQNDRHIRLCPARCAFTLLELLIVIAIIALLMSLSFVAMTGLSDQAEEDATATTIQKVNRLLEQRVEAFDRAFKGARKQNAINGTLTLLSTSNIHGVREEVVEILAKKALFRFEFPQRMVERIASGDTDSILTGMPDSVFNLVVVPRVRQELIQEGIPTPTNAQILTRATARWAGGTDGGKTFPGHNPATESVELLYFALIASGNFGATPVDGDRFTNEELQDTIRTACRSLLISGGTRCDFIAGQPVSWTRIRRCRLSLILTIRMMPPTFWWWMAQRPLAVAKSLPGT